VPMTDKPLPEDEPGADERFGRAIKKALNTPPKPHNPKLQQSTDSAERKQKPREKP
jgi:hypothetical protein